MVRIERGVKDRGIVPVANMPDETGVPPEIGELGVQVHDDDPTRRCRVGGSNSLHELLHIRTVEWVIEVEDERVIGKLVLDGVAVQDLQPAVA